MSNSSSGSFFGANASEEAFNRSPWPENTDSEFLERKAPRSLAPNLTRRSHKKSRGGCFSCKTRKIKVSSNVSILSIAVSDKQQCQETKPLCENCGLKGLECRYPSDTDQKIIRRPRCTPESSRVAVKPGEQRLAPTLSPPTSFSMDDMRCFHHFLTVAYPHLPLGNDSVWVQEIPVIAQQVRVSRSKKIIH